MNPGRYHHLPTDERQDQGQALVEVLEPRHRAGAQEAEGPQAENHEDVGGVHHEEIRRGPQDHGHRVEREE